MTGRNVIAKFELREQCLQEPPGRELAMDCDSDCCPGHGSHGEPEVFLWVGGGSLLEVVQLGTGSATGTSGVGREPQCLAVSL